MGAIHSRVRAADKEDLEDGDLLRPVVARLPRVHLHGPDLWMGGWGVDGRMGREGGCAGGYVDGWMGRWVGGGADRAGT